MRSDRMSCVRTLDNEVQGEVLVIGTDSVCVCVCVPCAHVRVVSSSPLNPFFTALALAP